MAKNQKLTTAIDVRLCGLFAIAMSLAAAGFLLFHKPAIHGIHHPKIGFAIAAGISLIGAGTVLLWRCAAVLLSIISSLIARGVIWGLIRLATTISPAELAFDLVINFFLVIFLLMPVFCTVGSWRELR